MTITQTKQDNTITISLSGRLDSVTQSELSTSLDTIFSSGPTNLIFDFTQLLYISSAGLRVLLSAQKKVNASGNTMKITGAAPDIKAVFEITGFSGIMNVE